MTAPRTPTEVLKDARRRDSHQKRARIFAAVDVPIQRLVRVAIGRLALGDLAKGAWRMLRPDEVDLLGGKA